MEPIILTQFGETLVEWPDFRKTEEDEFQSVPFIGIHQVCNGKIDVQPVSGAYNVVRCRKCGLRIVIPEEVDTYKKLREYCGKQIKLIATFPQSV